MARKKKTNTSTTTTGNNKQGNSANNNTVSKKKQGNNNAAKKQNNNGKGNQPKKQQPVKKPKANNKKANLVVVAPEEGDPAKRKRRQMRKLKRKQEQEDMEVGWTTIPTRADKKEKNKGQRKQRKERLVQEAAEKEEKKEANRLEKAERTRQAVDNNPIKVVLNIPKDVHRHIIGKGGQNIARVRSEAGCGPINVPAADADSDEVTVSAPTQEAADKAAALIHALIEERKNRGENAERPKREKREREEREVLPCVCEMEIPKELHRFIIGMQGLTIQGLVAATNARFELPKSSLPSSTVKVSAADDATLASALTELEKVVKDTLQMNPRALQQAEKAALAESTSVYHQCRSFARQHASARSRLLTASKKAYESGDKPGARTLSEKGKAHGAHMATAQAAALEAIFRPDTAKVPEGLEITEEEAVVETAAE